MPKNPLQPITIHDIVKGMKKSKISSVIKGITVIKFDNVNDILQPWLLKNENLNKSSRLLLNIFINIVRFTTPITKMSSTKMKYNDIF